MAEEYESAPLDPVATAFSSPAALRDCSRRLKRSQLIPLQVLLKPLEVVLARRRADQSVLRKDAPNNIPDVYGKGFTRQRSQSAEGTGYVQMPPNAA
jgi:hypothetical protein